MHRYISFRFMQLIAMLSLFTGYRVPVFGNLQSDIKLCSGTQLIIMLSLLTDHAITDSPEV